MQGNEPRCVIEGCWFPRRAETTLKAVVVKNNNQKDNTILTLKLNLCQAHRGLLALGSVLLIPSQHRSKGLSGHSNTR